jgi:hypothetical protein
MSIKDKPLRTSSRAQPLKKAWWKSHWVWFPFCLLVIWGLGMGIPWFRGMSILVPTIENSQISTGKFVSEQSKGYFGKPLILGTEKGQMLIFSCGKPEPKWTSASCFKTQSNYLGKELKIYWSHQPVGYSSGTVMRPTQIEMSDGTVIFSRAEAIQFLSVQKDSYSNSILVFSIVLGLFYFPLMFFFDWAERRETEINLNSYKE